MNLEEYFAPSIPVGLIAHTLEIMLADSFSSYRVVASLTWSSRLVAELPT